jgi:hypothetical protein
MYLLAQQVRSARGAEGVNVALYSHAGVELPAGFWQLAPGELLASVTGEYPGRRLASRAAVPPGGNSVQSFLDVAAPDEVTEAELEDALAALRAEMMEHRRSQRRHGRITAELSVNLGEAHIEAAFNRLAAAALALYRDRTPSPWLAQPPLRIDTERDAAGWSFRLAAESADRVRAAGGRPARVQIRYEIADNFRRTHGKLYPHAAEWVTNLPRERLLTLGGTRFVEGGTVVDEWPERPEEDAH